ncbi:MAG: TetR family transcriptional regulator [Rhizobiales bacterium]|nr:TetR family transcriptional regulator [Hyphomicrobiales bacterium]
MERFDVTPAEVRERVRTAAITLVREQGLPRLAQSLVAKAAGVSQSHLTHYFPKRVDLTPTHRSRGC